MPRIYTSQSDPLDFCKSCFPKVESKAFAVYGSLGDGPDGRGNCFSYDDEHPPYEDEGCLCEVCSKVLTNRDN